MEQHNICNNCGKKGHLFVQCRMPIISVGIIAVRKNPNTGKNEFCMICRRNTLGFMDFIRGKYSIINQYQITNMIKQMSESEKNALKTKDFDELWSDVWGNPKKLCGQYKTEENISRENFNHLRRGVLFIHPPPGIKHPNVFLPQILGYNLEMLIDNCGSYWEEPEWGFPKGRRNYNETDMDCGLREFCEETGFKYSKEKCGIVQNIFPFEEIFVGSNYKSYKHKYFIMFVDYEYSLDGFKMMSQNFEVSQVQWKDIDDCMLSIRSYNLEKKEMIKNINAFLSKYSFK